MHRSQAPESSPRHSRAPRAPPGSPAACAHRWWGCPQSRIVHAPARDELTLRKPHVPAFEQHPRRRFVVQQRLRRKGRFLRHEPIQITQAYRGGRLFDHPTIVSGVQIDEPAEAIRMMPAEPGELVAGNGMADQQHLRRASSRPSPPTRPARAAACRSRSRVCWNCRCRGESSRRRDASARATHRAHRSCAPWRPCLAATGSASPCRRNPAPRAAHLRPR